MGVKCVFCTSICTKKDIKIGLTRDVQLSALKDCSDVKGAGKVESVVLWVCLEARDLWHLVSRLYRKVAAHTLCLALNRQLGKPQLQFDGLVTV